jgi:peptidoglycan hydrolase-like protein with peptidoglycan-binding domain
MRTRRILAVLAAALLLAAEPAFGMGNPSVAALQVALRARGVYEGTIDGRRGPATTAAVVRFQLGAGLVADGVVGPKTRKALGKRGRPPYGSRPLSFGAVGWDVAALQFALAWQGFPSGVFDGRFGPRVDAALRAFQARAGIGADGVAGPASYRALRGPLPRSPLRVSMPVSAPFGDGFGPRGDRFHSGIDFPAARGATVVAARVGWVVFAGQAGSYGRLVVISHGRGVETWYGHLSRILVTAGEHVGRGRQIGRVGSSGRSTGPHLHFEVRSRGAIVDPVTALR